MFIIYSIAVVMNWIVWVGDKEYPLAILFSFIPILNITLAVGGIIKIFQVIKNSKGKCWWNHKGKLVYDSEGEKWKDGRMPLRISRGGIEKYECERCKHCWIRSWSAFD